jgi:hypothetical protein
MNVIALRRHEPLVQQAEAIVLALETARLKYMNDGLATANTTKTIVSASENITTKDHDMGQEERPSQLKRRERGCIARPPRGAPQQPLGQA